MLKVCFYWRIVKLKIDCYCPHHIPHSSAFHTFLCWRKWPQNNIILNVSDEISNLAYCLVAAALESGLWWVFCWMIDGGYTSGTAQLPFALAMNFFRNMMFDLSMCFCVIVSRWGPFSQQRGLKPLSCENPSLTPLMTLKKFAFFHQQWLILCILCIYWQSNPRPKCLYQHSAPELPCYRVTLQTLSSPL